MSQLNDSLLAPGARLLSGEMTIDDLVQQATNQVDGPVFSARASEDLCAMNEAEGRHVRSLLQGGIPESRPRMLASKVKDRWYAVRLEKCYDVFYRFLDKAELSTLGRADEGSGLDVLIGAVRRVGDSGELLVAPHEHMLLRVDQPRADVAEVAEATEELVKDLAVHHVAVERVESGDRLAQLASGVRSAAGAAASVLSRAVAVTNSQTTADVLVGVLRVWLAARPGSAISIHVSDDSVELSLEVLSSKDREQAVANWLHQRASGEYQSTG